ncbi:hypothetical protein [Haloparvum sp. AD34]
MEKLRRYYQKVYDYRITCEYDHVLPIIGDEGDGKSTLMLESMIFWQDIRGIERDPERILDRLIYDRNQLKNAMADSENRSVIPVPDAARVLHKKEAMTNEQLELEKDFFDVRTNEYLILLGYQDWESMPTFLQRRRAKNAIYIPQRGLIRGYNRESLDERLKRDSWPRADLTDTFPSLEGTDIWEQYQEMDKQKKDERMAARDEEEEQEEDPGPQEVASMVKDDGVETYISINSSNKVPYLNKDLIQVEYGLSHREANQVKSLLEADPEVTIDEEAVAP